MRPLTFGSLFAGVGGFDMGFEAAGLTCLWQCEIDKQCRKLLGTKWPKAKQHDNVQTFNPDDFECPAVICFGSPCQDLSIAGKRAGIKFGERSGLFFDAVRIIRHYVGRGLEFAVWENVPGSFSSNGGRDFACVLRAMAELGALDVAWGVLDAQFFNVPQRRERVFLVADFRGERAAEILSFADCLSGDPPPSRTPREGPAAGARAGVADCGKSLAASDGGVDREDRHTLIPEVAPTLLSGVNTTGGTRPPGSTVDNCDGLIPDVAWALQERDGKGADTETKRGHLIPAVADPLVAREGKTYTHEGATFRLRNVVPQESGPIAFSAKDHGADASNEVSPTLRAGGHNKSHANGGVMPAIAFQTRIARNGRGQPEEICPALNGSNAGATSDMRPVVASPEIGVRRLMPIECERLQGFPDGHTDGFSDSTRYRMMGNAVCVKVSEWLGRRIVAALS